MNQYTEQTRIQVESELEQGKVKNIWRRHGILVCVALAEFIAYSVSQI